MKDLRLISLRNVLYKLISQTLANRLKTFLPDIIDDNQSVFVPERLITDNILLASDIFYFMNISSARKRGFMALKLDMSKAYNRIEWDYLNDIMLHMGFLEIWVVRVMECVTLVSYSFLVNGQLTSPMFSQRSLRQGDPLSSYLFLLCVEGLGALIKQAFHSKMLREVCIAKNALDITHLFFC